MAPVPVVVYVQSEGLPLFCNACQGLFNGQLLAGSTRDVTNLLTEHVQTNIDDALQCKVVTLIEKDILVKISSSFVYVELQNNSCSSMQ